MEETKIELDLLQAEFYFDRRFDSSGENVIGYRVFAKLGDINLHVDAPRFTTKDELREALARLGDMIWATAAAESLDA